MKNNITKYILFATGCFRVENVNLDHNKILKEIIKLKYKDVGLNNPLIKDNINTGTKISVDNKILNKKYFKKEIEQKIKTYLDEAIQNFFQYNIDYEINTSWATCTSPHAMTQYHIHRNYWLSGCYYPHGSLEDNFYISFETSNYNHFDVPLKNYNPFNQTEFSINIKKGDLLIFPSDLRHKIGLNLTDKKRYSIAFNILPKGKIGYNDGELLLCK